MISLHPADAGSDVIRGLLPRPAAIASEIMEMLRHEINELPDDPTMEALLEACVSESVSAAMHVIAYGADLRGIDTPPAALEYVRHLAQRGSPIAPLLRAYGLCQARLIESVCRELQARSSLPNQSAASALAIVHDVATFVNGACEQLVAAYQVERELWVGTKAAVRQQWLAELLDGEVPDIRRAEAALGYGMSGWHLAVEAWINGPVAAEDVASLFDQVGTALRRLLGVKTDLMVPNDASSARFWFPLRRHVEVEARAVAACLKDAHLPVRVAIGIPREGHAGFRASAISAARVKSLAVGSPQPTASALTFRSVTPVALLTDEPRELKWFVEATLGSLVVPDERHAILRESLLVFLELGRNYRRTADRLLVHRNTVHDRIKRAIDALGRDLEEDALTVQLALLVCKWHHVRDETRRDEGVGPVVVRAKHGGVNGAGMIARANLVDRSVWHTGVGPNDGSRRCLARDRK